MNNGSVLVKGTKSALSAEELGALIMELCNRDDEREKVDLKRTVTQTGRDRVRDAHKQYRCGMDDLLLEIEKATRRGRQR